VETPQRFSAVIFGTPQDLDQAICFGKDTTVRQLRASGWELRLEPALSFDGYIVTASRIPAVRADPPSDRDAQALA